MGTICRFSTWKAVAIAIIAGSMSAFGQVEIQWITPSSTSPSLKSGQALAISKATMVRVTITDVNDILYDHRIKLTLIQKQFNDAANLYISSSNSDSEKTLTKKDCECVTKFANELAKATHDYEEGKKDFDKKYIPLETTLEGLNRVQKAIKALLADSKYAWCRDKDLISKDKDVQEKLDRLSALPHAVSAEVLVDPVFDLKIEVSAFAQVEMKPKKVGDTYTVTIGTFTNQLSLSLGVMATTLESRTFSSRNSVANGALAANQLVVENRGVRPIGVALLNYALVGAGGSKAQDRFGVSLSAGPTVGVGQAGASSAFGFFGGVTFRLWDRLFLTPGAHLGQFADFPPGLQNGVTIPANYGALTPVNRWTTRLGFAISFRTNDFSGVKKSGTTKGSTNVPAAK